MRSIAIVVLPAFLLMFAGCDSGAGRKMKATNEMPMYGGVPRTSEEQKSDQEFVDNMLSVTSRKKHVAYQQMIEKGWEHFFQKEYGKAMRRFNQAWLIDPEHPAAFFGFGSIMLQTGDRKGFIKWTLISAEKGFANAQNNMGWAYLEGIGVEKDEKKAFEWLLKAANQKHFNAMPSVAKAYHEGMGVPKDEEKAKYWLDLYLAEKEKQDKLNDAEKIFNAGFHHLLSGDPEKAFVFFKEAATEGSANAQNALGLVYEWGYGVDQDLKYSKEWYDLADANEYTGGLISWRKVNAKSLFPESQIVSLKDVIELSRAESSVLRQDIEDLSLEELKKRLKEAREQVSHARSSEK